MERLAGYIQECVCLKRQGSKDSRHLSIGRNSRNYPSRECVINRKQFRGPLAADTSGCEPCCR